MRTPDLQSGAELLTKTYEIVVFQPRELDEHHQQFLVALMEQRFGASFQLLDWQQYRTQGGWQSCLRFRAQAQQYLDLYRFFEDAVDLGRDEIEQRLEYRQEESGIKSAVQRIRAWLTGLMLVD